MLSIDPVCGRLGFEGRREKDIFDSEVSGGGEARRKCQDGQGIEGDVHDRSCNACSMASLGAWQSVLQQLFLQ